MKKIYAILIAISVVLGMANPTNAAANVNDDLSGLVKEIMDTSNDLYQDKLSREVTEADIDFGSAYKIYVGTNIFKADIESVEEIPEAFGDTGYIYELPIYIDSSTLIVNIAKGEPLNESAEFTEEERENILNNVGKWQVTAIKYYENEIINYASELEGIIGYIEEDAVLVGGLPRFRYAVALLPNDSGLIDGLVPLSDVPGLENINSLRSDSDNIYNYNEVKEYINQLPEPADDEAGAYGFLDNIPVQTSYNYFPIIFGAIILVVVGSVVAIRYRNKNVAGGKK